MMSRDFLHMAHVTTDTSRMEYSNTRSSNHQEYFPENHINIIIPILVKSKMRRSIDSLYVIYFENFTHIRMDFELGANGYGNNVVHMVTIFKLFVRRSMTIIQLSKV